MCLPKIAGLVIFIPLLVIFSMFTGILGGIAAAVFTSMLSVDTYTYGLKTMFVEYYVFYSIQKSLVFAFIIASVASFYGYTVKGGAI